MAYRRFGRRRFRKKRWYVSAGANLPFIGKTNVSFGSGAKSKQKRAMYSIAKKVVRSTVEPKRFINRLDEETGLTQNTVYTHNITELITKGTDDDNRIGERIHLKNLLVDYEVHGVFAGNALYDGYHKQFRILVIKSRHEFSTSGWDSGATFGSTELFEHGHVNHFMKGPILKENVTVLFDKCITYQHPSKTDVNISNKNGVFNVPLDCTYQYNDQFATSSTFGKNWNLYLVLIPHIPGGTTAESMQSEFNFAYHINFSDTK